MKLIDKDALVAEIKRRKELVSDPILSGNDLMIGESNAYFNLLSFIDSMQEESVSEDTPFEPIGIPADALKLANIPNKKEPTIPDIVDEHFDEMLGEEHVSNKMGGINNALSQDILAMKSVDEAMAEVEEKAKAFTEAHKGESSEQLLAQMRGEDPVSEDLEKEIEIYMKTHLEWDLDALGKPIERWGIKIARHFAAWQKEQDKQWLAENHKHIFAKGRESAEVWISADDNVNNAAEKTTRRFCKISLLSGDYLSLAEAQPQVNKESKLIAIKSFVCGAQWDRNKLMKEAKLYGWVARDENGSLHLFEVEPSRREDSGQWWDRDYNCTTLDKNDFPDLEWEDEPVYVKLIILKEE